MFGAKNRRARELAHEILRPLGVETKDLKEHSRINFEAQIKSVVKRDKDNELYNRQTGWSKGDL
jgi:hypothetical protein